MSKHTAAMLALVAFSAQAQTCVPKVLGGSGVNVDLSVSHTGAGWISWWCPTTRGPQLRLLASPGLSATMQGLHCFLRSQNGPTKAIAVCAPGDVNQEPLRSVWMQDAKRIASTKPI